MSAGSGHRAARTRSRVVALTAIAGLVTGLAGVAAAPASAATIPTPDPQCAVAPYTPPSSTPVLTSLAVSPTAVDVRTGARSVVVTAAARDTVPLSRISVYVDGPKGTRSGFFVHLALVGGTTLNGTWRGTLVVPQWDSRGVYRVEEVLLVDSQDGSSRYGPSSPGWGSWTTTFTVKSVPDVTAPRLRGFSTSTRSVNTSAGAKKIRVRAVLTDRESGVRWVTAYVVRDLSRARFFATQLTRSTKDSHVWVGTIVVPAWQGKGTSTWKLRVVASDRIGRVKTWTRSDLAARGFRSTVRVTSRSDTTPPSIAGVAVAPTSIDARTGAKKLTFSVRVTDPQSGPGGIDVTGHRLPVSWTSITGGAHDKTYTGYVLVPQCGASGTWTLRFDVTDAWGAARQWPLSHQASTTRTVTVQQLDGVGPEATSPATVPAGGSLTVTFSEPTLFASPIESTVATRVNGFAAAGTWVCRNGSTAVVVCDADGADVVTATFTPTSPLVSHDQIVVTAKNVLPAPVGIYDLAGNPMGFGAIVLGLADVP